MHYGGAVTLEVLQQQSVSTITADLCDHVQQGPRQNLEVAIFVVDELHQMVEGAHRNQRAVGRHVDGSHDVLYADASQEVLLDEVVEDDRRPSGLPAQRQSEQERRVQVWS